MSETESRATDRTTSGSPRTAAPQKPANQDSSSRSSAAAFPGDRGNRSAPASPQRPSFWRRIALGRRASEPEPERDAPGASATGPVVEVATRGASLIERAKEAAAATSATASPRSVATVDTRALETRIMEPMLQALVSVEAKLERSHTELMGRSDQVEQRLTQLWDIEEQLGTLSDLQDSLLQVSEQQRRLEAAVVGQTRTLRWLIGAVFFSLAAAAFVVAAIR